MSYFTIVSLLVLVAAFCDSSTNAVDKRIVGGTTASPGQFPYIVSLRTTANVHFCGGSIISVRWILTSAQCLSIVPNFNVVAGTTSLTTGGTTYQVAKFTKHNSFNPITFIYDVGVVQTLSFISYSGTVMPIILTNMDPVTGAPGVITGWGSTAYPSTTPSNTLQYLNTNLISNADCQTRVTGLGFTLQSTQICTFKPLGGDCVADDGGPVAVSFLQYGIVSVYACGVSTYADVHTSVARGKTACNKNRLYQVSLRTDNIHFCAGTILNHYVVLTSGQCLDHNNTFTIVIGSYNLASGGVVYQVSSFLKHPQYNYDSLLYDVGLINTTTSIVFSGRIRPIALATTRPTVGAVGISSGWGVTNVVTQTLSNKLQSLKTTVINDTDCENKLAVLGYILQMTQFCTFSPDKGACLNDDGGPFVIGGKQFGIISAYRCGQNTPDIYTMSYISDSFAGKVNKRIVNGITVCNKNRLYLASLRSAQNIHFCGGTILNHYVVLTSGQCLDNVNNFTVVIGSFDLLSGGVVHQVSYFAQHPLYDSTSLLYDAGIVKTAKYMVFSGRIRPISLATTWPTTGFIGISSGWGYTVASVEKLSNKLISFKTTVINEMKCYNTLAATGYYLQSTQFCTFMSHQGACAYDDGGPFVIGAKQYGIISVYGCGLGYPDVYTSIANVSSWITTYI
ncbi:hypothetical protein RN001_011406 [Aquatica leii]|uniref:Peptidase S1 domain-containing protein n=1 Tax=Aquatica leii TaxID=1421715 RepID=A0AAN7Q418_9COLE|nr:hypothetical protein RN001_011406 [Aquatica leii]